jgi:hypothetical protein
MNKRDLAGFCSNFSVRRHLFLHKLQKEEESIAASLID